jgi:hypothetical protein
LENFHGKLVTVSDISKAIKNDDDFYSAKQLLQHAELCDDDRDIIELSLNLTSCDKNKIYSF